MRTTGTLGPSAGPSPQIHKGARRFSTTGMTPTSNKNHAPYVIVAVGASLIASCAVGPNFKKPAAPDVSDYTAAPLASTASANVAGGQTQNFAKGADIAADWWSLFHSKPLNDLIDQSLAGNPDLKAAHAALSVARENVLAQRGVYYPNVSANFAASRQRQSGQISPALNSNVFLYNLFTPQVSVSYVPDVFGLNRRTVGIIAGTGTGSALPNAGDVHHVDGQCGRHCHSRSLHTDADRRHPPADRGQLEHAANPAISI